MYGGSTTCDLPSWGPGARGPGSQAGYFMYMNLEIRQNCRLSTAHELRVTTYNKAYVGIIAFLPKVWLVFGYVTIFTILLLMQDYNIYKLHEYNVRFLFYV